MVFPVLLLLAGAGLIGFFRRASSFTLWAIVVASVFLAWLSLLLATGGQAGALDLSVWRPEPLFSAELVLVLGRSQWDVVYAAATLLMALVLTTPARDSGERAADWALFLGYASLGLLAMMAGNLLTLSLLLIVLDITAFVFVLRRAGEGPGGQQAVLKLGVESIGVLLLLTAGLIGTLGKGGGEFTERQAVALDLLLALGVGLRIGLVPLPLGIPAQAAARRSLGALMRLVPPVALMVHLALQWPEGVTDAYRGWLIVVGAVAALTAGAAWAFAKNALDSRAQLVACAAGLAMMVSGGVSTEISSALSAIAVLLLLSGGLASVAEVHTPFHRLWPALLSIACLGVPLTVGGALLGDMAIGAEGLALDIGVGIGLGLLAAGVAQVATLPETPWPRAEGYGRLLFGVGLALFPTAAIGYGLREGFSVSIATAVGLFAALVTAAIAFLIRRRRLEREIRRAERIVAWLDVSPLVRGAWEVYRGVLRYAGSVGYTLEGEGAFLWVMALVVLVAALLTGSAR